MHIQCPQCYKMNFVDDREIFDEYQLYCQCGFLFKPFNREEMLKSLKNVNISNWYHVFPVADIEPHDLNSFDCKCNPNINYEDMLVVHNAFDKRDVLDEISNSVFGDLDEEED